MDYIIRGGLVIDGTGHRPFVGDVAVTDGLIEAVGGSLFDEGAKIIDATGCVVTPGFIDVHTHYDGQAAWDDLLEPTSSHGVTTLVMGNCGVGFAPMRGRDRETLIDLMEGVEDIPGTALAEGIPLNMWETFPQYLDFLESRAYSMDISGYIPHGALRFYVMGARGARNEDATVEDIRQMAALTREAMEAGALGLSTSRTVFHRSLAGDEPVPGTFASEQELFALTEAVSASGRGIVQAIPAGAVGDGGGALKEAAAPRDETALFAKISRLTGVPITFSVAQPVSDPQWWRDALDLSLRANETGACLRPQVAPRAVTVLQGLSIYHRFQGRPTYKRIAHLPLSERVAEMKRDSIRASILSETDEALSVQMRALMYFYEFGLSKPVMYRMGRPVNYEPDPKVSISSQIAESGADPESFLYDLLLEEGGHAIYMHLMANYVEGNLNACHDMLADENTILGLGDAGAHSNFICDGSNPTFTLSHWAKLRSRGARIPVEKVVAKLTSVNADFFGFRDRGRILRGLRADLNVIDMERLAVMPPRLVQDLPAGGVRLVQDAIGYAATFVAGQMTRCDGQDTGRRPGRLVRSVPPPTSDGNLASATR